MITFARPRFSSAGISRRCCIQAPFHFLSDRARPFTTGLHHAMREKASGPEPTSRDELFANELKAIVAKFEAPVAYAFAYGSGVFLQSAKSSCPGPIIHVEPPNAIKQMQGGNQKMIDFIFGVSSSEQWHELNLQQYRDHYGVLGNLGKFAVAQCQDAFGAGVYFHPFITVNGALIKYGVANMDTICRDLLTWDTLYIAGRLQKPTRTIWNSSRVQEANQANLLSAINVALLLLPETFTEQELYTTIAGISYLGDPRMSVGGDNPQKVQNMIKHQLDDFRKLYNPLLKGMSNISTISCQSAITHLAGSSKLQQNLNPTARGRLVRNLPSAFRAKVYSQFEKRLGISLAINRPIPHEVVDEGSEGSGQELPGSFEVRLAQDDDLRQEIKRAIQKTVRWPSLTQSIKSAITAGFNRSWRYAIEKRQKAASGRR
ncbi:MMP37-like protein [Aspergillus sergii]|uniref:Phosphatidate cytidylyltransferase, mitochondrial n=1 Tax=Aspergillus sergii TaxID=1034303 RepID=A0A5N6WP39_9EURO|nr:MMP37-like protein [Aspergillus sergii]